MRTLHNIATAASMIALAAASDAGSSGNNDKPAELKMYLVTVGPRNSKEKGEPQTFVIQAVSYKSAWELGREVTRTGSTDFADSHKGALRTSKEDDAVPAIKAGIWSVKSVDSLAEKRSKKDALTVDRMLEVCEERKVSIPKALRELIDELNSAGPAAAQAPEGEQQQASA